MTKPRQITDSDVRALQRSTRSRTVEYLCRAWLQFGSDAMGEADLKRLSAAINDRAKATP
jgi:hypothetical protein